MILYLYRKTNGSKNAKFVQRISTRKSQTLSLNMNIVNKISLLDISVKLRNRCLITSSFIKPTEKFRNLQHSSVH